MITGRMRLVRGRAGLATTGSATSATAFFMGGMIRLARNFPIFYEGEKVGVPRHKALGLAQPRIHSQLLRLHGPVEKLAGQRQHPVVIDHPRGERIVRGDVAPNNSVSKAYQETKSVERDRWNRPCRWSTDRRDDSPFLLR